MTKFNTRFHLLRLSPWPLILSFNIAILLYSLILTYKYFIIINIISLIIGSLGWLNEIKLESSFEGAHTLKQNQILTFGFLLFLLSEILIFSTLFGSYFYNAINPSIELYNNYPYNGINPINSLGLPLLNTLLLYFSGLTCTAAINYINKRRFNYTIQLLLLTILISFIFSSIQYYEYNNALFTITDGIYGTNFYILTGFHGLHVIVGTLFLLYSLFRVISNTVTINNSLGLTASSLYWHLVDAIWLLLYIALYLWGS